MKATKQHKDFRTEARAEFARLNQVFTDKQKQIYIQKYIKLRIENIDYYTIKQKCEEAMINTKITNDELKRTEHARMEHKIQKNARKLEKKQKKDSLQKKQRIAEKIEKQKQLQKIVFEDQE